MGYAEQFPFQSAEEIFEEIRRVTPSYAGMTYERLDRPEALHWPCPTVEHPGTPILHREKFSSPDGLGVFAPIEWKPPAEVPDEEYPFVFTTGRILWHWHTGTMTRRSATLANEVPTGWIEINTEDAKALGITNGEIVRAVTRRGSVEVPAKVTDDIMKGVMFMPFHFQSAGEHTDEQRTRSDRKDPGVQGLCCAGREDHGGLKMAAKGDMFYAWRPTPPARRGASAVARSPLC